MSYHEVIYPEFFQASLAAIPILLLSSFLNEKFIERTEFIERTKIIYKVVIIASILAMTISLINLLPIAGLQTPSPWKSLSCGVNILAFFICASGVGALGFIRIDEATTDEVDHGGTTELEAETKQDKKNNLDNSTKSSVAAPEGFKQQAIDTPKEESKNPQGEPKPKESTEDSNKEE